MPGPQAKVTRMSEAQGPALTAPVSEVQELPEALMAWFSKGQLAIDEVTVQEMERGSR